MKKTLFRRGRQIAASSIDFGLLGLGKARALFPSIRATFEGDHFKSDVKKHAVFVHYDPVGQVHDYVVAILLSLREAGYEITLVSNSPKLPSASIELLKPMTRLIVHRFNSGYDFAAYRDGINLVPDLDNAEALIVMNDSVYGPLFSMKETLDSIDPNEVDVWGITDSWEIRYHLQGYFLLFFQNAIRSNSFKKFWKKLPNVSSKWWVIRNAEAKITQLMAREKLRISVQCPYWEVANHVLAEVNDIVSDNEFKLSPDVEQTHLTTLQSELIGGDLMNQSHQFWDAGIKEWKCLFIKRELIQKNPLNVPMVWKWKEVVEGASDYDTDMIDRHLHSL